MNMGIYSCKGCDGRHPGCHAACPAYQKEKAENDAKMDAYRKQRSVQSGLSDHVFRTVAKATKRMGGASKKKGLGRGYGD